jgi:hypothetical protein
MLGQIWTLLQRDRLVAPEVLPVGPSFQAMNEHYSSTCKVDTSMPKKRTAHSNIAVPDLLTK